MIGTEKIEKIKDLSHENIVEVISDFVQLKKRGSTYVGLSPFSNERTPSFTVHPAKGIFKCFSSGKGGDCISFLMAIQSFTFYQAVKYLALKFNIDIDDQDMTNVFYTPVHRVVQEKEPDFIHPEELLNTVGKGWEGNYCHGNNLYLFLYSRFGAEKVDETFKKYYVGTTLTTKMYVDHYVIFWQVDINTNVRSGKFIKYKPDGHRDKDSSTTWFHKKTVEYKPVYPDFNLVQCLFGEHLIADDIRKPIAVVESEKTALVCSIMMDKYIWVACGSKNGLSESKLAILRNRGVTLFPDLGAYNEWRVIAEKNNFNVSDVLEKEATEEERKKGLDLADFLLK